MPSGFFLSSAIAAFLFLAPAVADDGPKPLLPAEAVWAMRYDAKLDGELKAKKGEDVRWKFSVRNNRISGSLAGKKEGDTADHHISGEVVEGKPAIVNLRQDGPKGLVCFYTGKLTDDGHVIGTWFDNRGSSGDFDMVVEKKSSGAKTKKTDAAEIRASLDRARRSLTLATAKSRNNAIDQPGKILKEK